jgi:hypothetical protein
MRVAERCSSHESESVWMPAPTPGRRVSVREAVVLLGCVVGRCDWLEAVGAADGVAGRELGPSLGELRGLLVAPGLLAALALGLLLGPVLLDRGRGDPLGELGEHLRSRELLRLVDALPVRAGRPSVSTSRCASNRRRTTASASSGVRARISRSVPSRCSSFSACAPRG